MPLFTQTMRDAARVGFQTRLALAGDAGQPVAARLEALSASAPDTADALYWLYGTSPLSDWTNYDFSLFRDCAAHGVYLRSRRAGDISEDVFLHYVLPLRVNEEALLPCRRAFWTQLAPRLEGLDRREAGLAVNYWCAEQVSYRSTDSRTRSAWAVYRSGYGRCGEESVFAVNALRSVGVPARQIYTPRWAHCDDNHAWVEVWVEGAWHFLGACEPEEVLDRGWFTSAASRAMVVHSRRFGPSASGEEVISQAGAVTYLNQLPRYADTKTLTVRVTDSAGRPAAGAEVAFGILNMAEAYPAAVVRTAVDGTAHLTCGLGSFCLRAWKDGDACEQLVCTRDMDTAALILAPEQPILDVWEDFEVIAPRDRPSPFPQPTEAQKALGREKAAAAARERLGKARPASGAGRFLKDAPFSEAEKTALLATLSEKDRQDIDPAILWEALDVSGAYRDCGALFYPYVACPRVADESLRPCRRFILDYFSWEQKERFREDPMEIWHFIRENIRFEPSAEYENLVTLPAGALTFRRASPLSQRILFVSVCRTLGIPARLHPADGRAEYWVGSAFRAVDAPAADCTVVLEKQAGERWQYGTDFALGVLEGGGFRTLELSGLAWEGDRLTSCLRPGEYRLLTDNRLPNGDLFASQYRFRLKPGEARTIRLRKHQADLPRMLASYALEDFTVYAQDGHPISGSELTQDRAVLLWLEEGAEPTEHLLNELLERQEAALTMRLVFLLRGKVALENATLRKALAAFPESRVYFDSFIPNVETLARRLYVDPEKLPLVVVTTKPLNAVYASSGYNVGSGDMLLRVYGWEGI